MKKTTAAGLGLVVSSLALTICGCPLTDGVLSGEQRAMIGVQGGRLEITSPTSSRVGAFVDIPAGALDEQTEIAIAPSNRRDVELDGSSPPLALLALEPSDTRFDTAVTVGLPYPADRDPNDLRVYRYGAADAVWILLPTQSIDTTKRVIAATTNHFSLFALGSKPTVEFDVRMYHRNSRLLAGVRVLTPLEDIPVRSESATDFSATTMRGVLEASPAQLRPEFTITLKQTRSGSLADSTLETVTIQYRVSSLLVDQTPTEVAAGLDSGPYYLCFPVSGDRPQALDETETLFAGEPVLFEFATVTPQPYADYYVEVLLNYVNAEGFVHNAELSEPQIRDSRAFGTTTKANLVHPGDLATPADADQNGVIDQYEEPPGDDGRPVEPPVFLPPDGTTFSDQVNVMIWCGTVGATLRYTTDGSTPTRTHGTEAPCGQSVEITATTTLKALAFKDGFPDSGVTTATYTKVGE